MDRPALDSDPAQAPDDVVLREVPVFQGVDTEHLEFLRKHLQLKTIGPAVDLIRLDEPNEMVFFLLEGTIRIYLMRAEHSETVLAILGPGEVLGEISAMEGTVASVSVMTLDRCRFLAMPGKDFARCLDRSSQLSVNLRRLLSRRTLRLTSHSEALATMNADARVARQLILFADDYGTPEGDSAVDGDSVARNGALAENMLETSGHEGKPEAGQPILIPLRLTQGNLAALCGSSLRQMNRIMQRFVQEGLIRVSSSHRITVLDIPALKQQCGLK